MQRNNVWHLLAAGAALLALSACGGADADGETEASAELQYNQSLAILPSPNDLAFAGSTDGTLNGTGNAAVDATDGFSTTASATATATVPLDPDSVEGGTSVRVFAVDTVDATGSPADPNDAANPGPKAVGGIDTAADLDGDGELTPGMEYQASVSAADRNNRTVAVTPLTALQPDTTYMVLLTDALRTQDGEPVSASDAYAEARGADPLVQSQLNVAAAAGVNTDAVIASWTFTTQTVGRTLDRVRSAVQDETPAFADATGTPNQLTPVPGSGLPVSIPAGDILTGVLAGVPYYLEPGTTDPQNVKTGSWTQADGSMLTPVNRMPAANAALNIPVLVALPANDGGGPSDVVIFQHPIGSDRTAMLGVANALTNAGLAVVAIDLPLHGVTDTASGLYAGDAERTFNVDLVDNDGSSGPDGEIDPSGEHFINLESLLTTRDNLRQAASDLFTVTRAIRVAAAGGVDLDNDGDADFGSDIRFLGHSLGAIVGGPFLATEPAVGTAALGMPGGHLSKLLDASPTFGPDIAAGLEAQGLTKGTPRYEQFLGAAQTVIDKGDPINYAARTARGGTAQPSGNAIPDRNTLLLEVVAGNSSPADQVVPNNVVMPYQQGIPDGTIPSPTAGTDPLNRSMMLQQVDADPMAPGDYLIRYSAGTHGSLLDPSANAMATTEMQTNTAAFLASDGASIQFAGTGTVAAP